MTYTDSSLEQIKSIYYNNYLFLQNLNKTDENSNCIDMKKTDHQTGKCNPVHLYKSLVQQNSLLNNLMNNTFIKNDNKKNKMNYYQDKQIEFFVYVNYILFLFYYIIVAIFLAFLIYRVFLSNTSQVNFEYIKNFFINYILIIILIVFYPYYIRIIALIVLNTLKYIYSVLTSTVYTPISFI